MKMRKIGLYTFLWLLLLIGAALAWVYSHRDTLQKQAVQQLNKNLKEPVQVGRVGWSLAQWPYLSLELENVYSAGSYGTAGDTFFFFQSVQLSLHWWQALQGRFSLRGVYLRQGKVHLHVHESKPNYQIFKTDTAASAGNLAIRQWQLQAILFTYRQQGEVLLKTQVKKAELKGTLLPQLDLYSRWDLEYLSLPTSGASLAPPAAVSLSGRLRQRTTHWSFEEAELRYAGMSLSFLYEYIEGAHNVSFTAEQQSFASLMEPLQKMDFWPPQLAVKGKGRWDLSGKYYQSGPRYNLDAHLALSQLNLRVNQGGKIEKGLMEVRYQQGMKGDGLYLDTLHLTTAGGYLSAGGRSENWHDRPLVLGRIDAKMPLEEWAHFWPSPHWADASGTMSISAELQREWPRGTQLQALPEEHWIKAIRKATVFLDGVTYRPAPTFGSLKKVNGALHLRGEDLEIERLYARRQNSDFYLSGRLGNFIPYLLQPQESLHIRGKLISQHLDIEDFLGVEPSSVTAQSDFMQYLAQLNLDLEMQVDEVEYRSFKIQSLQTRLKANGERVTLENLRAQFADGTINTEMTWAGRKDSLLWQGQVRTQNLNSRKVFAAFDQFGQSTLNSEHLKGKLDLNMQWNTRLSPTFQLDLTTLTGAAKYRISEGQLLQFEPLNALSRFADMDKLRQVYFDTLSGAFTISQMSLQFEPTYIRSSVLDVLLSGVHHFDNQIDYRVRLKVSSLLKGNSPRKALNNDLQQHLYVPKNREEPFLYLRMTGPAEAPSIILDQESWLRSVGDGIKDQKKDWRERFQGKKEVQEIEYEWDGF